MNNVRSGNEPTLSCKEQMVDSALKAGSLTGGGGYTAASTERIHAATPEGSFLRVGVIKSQSNRGEKGAGLKKEPNVAIFLPGVTALCLETRVARSWKETAFLVARWKPLDDFFFQTKRE